MNTVEDRLRAALAAKSDAVTEDKTRAAYDTEETPAEVIRLMPAGPGVPRRRVATVLAVAAMLLLAVGGVALHRMTAAHRFEPAQIRPRSAIPWNEVGPGWMLVQETPRTAPAGDHRVNAGNEQVQLVAPGGSRYQIASLGSRAWVLADWDEAHQRALLQSPIHEVPGQPHATTDLAVLDLRSGTQRSFTVQDAPYGARLGGPDGGHVILALPNILTTYSLTGQLERRIGTVANIGRTTDSRDGRQVIAGGKAGLQVFDYADGRLVMQFPAPSGYGRCSDPRWSGDGTLVANCHPDGQDDVTTATIVFSVKGVLGAGRQDPRFGSVGDRVTGFRSGVVGTSYRSWPLLTTMAATRFDSDGLTSPIQVPARFRAGSWMIANITADEFTVVKIFPDNAGLLSAAVRWNPFTGQVTELIRPSAPSAALIEVEPWGEQPY